MVRETRKGRTGENDVCIALALFVGVPLHILIELLKCLDGLMGHSNEELATGGPAARDQNTNDHTLMIGELSELSGTQDQAKGDSHNGLPLQTIVVGTLKGHFEEVRQVALACFLEERMLITEWPENSACV
jgi:hypothetical protein